MDSWQELSCNFFPVENIHIHSFNPSFILFFFNRRKSNSVYPFVRFIPLDLCFDKKREREREVRNISENISCKNCCIKNLINIIFGQIEAEFTGEI